MEPSEGAEVEERGVLMSDVVCERCRGGKWCWCGGGIEKELRGSGRRERKGHVDGGWFAGGVIDGMKGKVKLHSLRYNGCLGMSDVVVSVITASLQEGQGGEARVNVFQEDRDGGA